MIESILDVRGWMYYAMNINGDDLTVFVDGDDNSQYRVSEIIECEFVDHTENAKGEKIYPNSAYEQNTGYDIIPPPPSRGTKSKKRKTEHTDAEDNGRKKYCGGPLMPFRQIKKMKGKTNERMSLMCFIHAFETRDISNKLLTKIYDSMEGYEIDGHVLRVIDTAIRVITEKSLENTMIGGGGRRNKKFKKQLHYILSML